MKKTSVLILSQTAELPPSKVEESTEGYVELFGSPHIWDFAFHGDPYLRRSIYGLLQTSLSKRKGSLYLRMTIHLKFRFLTGLV